MKNKFLLMLAALITVFALTACGETEQTKSTPAPSSAPTAAAPAKTTSPSAQADYTQNKIIFEIEMLDGGVMKGELYPDLAPITVANFTKLCNENFYDGLIFHRVIPGFMIQGGGYDSNNTEKQTPSIKGEFSANGVENGLKHTRGIISMARTKVPDSASSQFFIMHEDAPSLDGQYAAFGKITDGLDIVDKIANVETITLNRMFEDYPSTPQVIKTIRITQ